MSRRRTGRTIVGALVAALLVATLCISPGFRHTHENGGEAHSHEETLSYQKRHDDSPGNSNSHSHSFGHSHSHGHHSHGVHSHGHTHRNRIDDESKDSASSEFTESQSHIHISFLWFELTLPDWSDGSNSPSLSSPTQKAAISDLVVISSPFSLSQLEHMLLLLVGPLPDRMRTPMDCLACYCLFQSGTLDQRLPDDVPVPPAELS